MGTCCENTLGVLWFLEFGFPVVLRFYSLMLPVTAELFDHYLVPETCITSQKCVVFIFTAQLSCIS